eukprot:CAMPEP_0178903384 /NCGR_PEP_ID=MMETSP0786-20121207/5126_1 /TAXON_ID=186022 /ORGANISM="Thalassionema frauenfeldii, Strain CCMP 1798" /LENGTH=521 /DNA_ID=CAMNT_0020574747 /DNA_START=8 /DNA_END=1573 /DNA_ORIENTATION=-
MRQRAVVLCLVYFSTAASGKSSLYMFLPEKLTLATAKSSHSSMHYGSIFRGVRGGSSTTSKDLAKQDAEASSVTGVFSLEKGKAIGRGSWRMPSDDNTSKSSMATSIFNLANNVAGAGILTLAAGKATGTGWIPSIIICFVLALCSSHTFVIIGKACEMTNEHTFKELWDEAFGERTAWFVDTLVFLQCFFVSIIYTGLLGDTFSALLRSGGSSSIFTHRTSVIQILAVCILWPLSLIKDVSSLAFTSILGLAAVLYTVFFIVLRSLDGTYSLKPVGKFVAEGEIILPSFDKSTLWNFDFNSLVLISNLGLAYIAHYNAPLYWKSLADATTKRFTTFSFGSYIILGLIYTVVMVAGYATFGDVCQGNILLNYAPNDVLSTLGRIATGFSLLFGFPLIFNGVIGGLQNASSALGISWLSNPKYHTALVTVLLFSTTSLSLVLKDVQLVAGLTGALIGSALVYIFPVMIYSNIVRKLYSKDSEEYRNAKGSLLFIPFGLFTASVGVYMTILFSQRCELKPMSL